MSIAKTVESYLQRYGIIHYTIIHHPRSVSSKQTAEAAHISPAQIAKAVILSDDKGCIMVVVPGDHHVERHRLSQKLGRRLELANEARIGPAFKDCELGAIPPIGPAYGMETIVDDSLVGQKKVYFVGGDHDELVCVDGEEFLYMLKQAQHGTFSH